MIQNFIWIDRFNREVCIPSFLNMMDMFEETWEALYKLFHLLTEENLAQLQEEKYSRTIIKLWNEAFC